MLLSQEYISNTGISQTRQEKFVKLKIEIKECSIDLTGLPTEKMKFVFFSLFRSHTTCFGFTFYSDMHFLFVDFPLLPIQMPQELQNEEKSPQGEMDESI